MRIAFQMDPFSGLNLASDSTIALMQEAQARGAECYYYAPESLCLGMDGVQANLARAQLNLKEKNWYTLAPSVPMPLADFDVILIRQDPPFDMHYLTATYLLEQLPKTVRVLNNPTAIRNAPEKLSVFQFKDFLPATLIGLDKALIMDFIATHKHVVAKPLYGFGGHSVFRFSKGDPNITTFLEHWQNSNGGALVWQEFLPDVKNQECRILMIDGTIACAFNRLPEEGSIRSNMRVGGKPASMVLSNAQQACMQALSPMLKKEGLILAGVDMIGPYLVEINITSPTGLRAAEALYGINVAAQFWDAVQLA